MKPFHALVCLAIGALLGMSATTVYASLEWREERCARQAALVDAFDAYTDALVASSEGTDRTPAERREFDERVAAFRADLDERLAPLAPTNC